MSSSVDDPRDSKEEVSRQRLVKLRSNKSSNLEKTDREVSYIETEDISQLNAAGELSELAVVAEGEDKTSWFIWLLVLCTSISGLLFGKFVREDGGVAFADYT